MSKSITIQLKEDYAQGSQTISRQWRATRKDGYTLAVTTCARDLLFEGVIYRAADGFIPKATAQEMSGAVMNSEVESALSEDITEIEFEAGLWDGAQLEVFELNYRAISRGKMWVASATMGEIRCTRSAFNAELRGLTQSMQTSIGRVISKGCDYDFGDPATCRKDLAPIKRTGSLTSVADLRTFTDSARAEADDYFGAGVITFVTGANAGLPGTEIYSFGSGQFVLHLPLVFNPAVGDVYSVSPGCRKRWEEDCKAKWNNGPNFGGFPFVPGGDTILGLAGTEGTNL